MPKLAPRMTFRAGLPQPVAFAAKPMEAVDG